LILDPGRFSNPAGRSVAFVLHDVRVGCRLCYDGTEKYQNKNVKAIAFNRPLWGLRIDSFPFVFGFE